MTLSSWKTTGELAKLDLSSQESVEISFRAKGRVFDVTLTRSKFEELVAPA